MSTLITGAAQVTPGWLTNELRASGALHGGHVAAVRTTVEPSYTSTIVRLALSYSDDAPQTAPAHLLLKLSRLDAEQRVVTGERRQAEVEFYSRVAAAMPDPPLARCYSAAYSPVTGASHLLFDDLSRTHCTAGISAPPPRPLREGVMRSFAEIHAYWWDRPALEEIGMRPRQELIDADIAGMRGCFPRFADFLGDRLSAEWRRTYDRVLSSLPRLLRRLTDGRPLTLIHGDANLSNVLLPRDPARDRALIIDWQFWNVSLAGEDLANLMALFWTVEQRRAMELGLLHTYYEALVGHGVSNYDWAACWYDYRLAVITRVLFMPMWFWVGGDPPDGVFANLERATQAFEDLGCDEILST